jgi:uncharacterized membrane protein
MPFHRVRPRLMLSGLLFLIPLGTIIVVVFFLIVVVFETLGIVDNSGQHTGQQAQEPDDLVYFHVFRVFRVS